LPKPRSYHTILPLPSHAVLWTLCQFHTSVFRGQQTVSSTHTWPHCGQYLEAAAANPKA
jgi:hypothetical protein